MPTAKSLKTTMESAAMASSGSTPAAIAAAVASASASTLSRKPNLYIPIVVDYAKFHGPLHSGK